MGSGASTAIHAATEAASSSELQTLFADLDVEAHGRIEAALLATQPQRRTPALRPPAPPALQREVSSSGFLQAGPPALQRAVSSSTGFPKSPGARKLSKKPKVAKAGLYATDSQARAVFDEIDANRDGSVAPDECIRYLKYMGYHEQEAVSFTKRADDDKDGRISFEEFKRSWAFLSTSEISGLDDCEVIRAPNSLCGLDIVVEDCSGATIVLADFTSQVQLINLLNCKVLVGPCSGSVFVRKCGGCTFSIATQQLRTRNVVDSTIYLYSATEPIIETSSDLRFATFNASYPQAACHFSRAALDASQNLWWAVYDFNADQACAAEEHWRELPATQWATWELDNWPGLGRPENPVPQNARAQLPQDSMRGQRMGPGSQSSPVPAGVQKSAALQVFKRYQAAEASSRWTFMEYQRFQADSGLDDLAVSSEADFDEIVSMLAATFTGFDDAALGRLLDMLELDAAALLARLPKPAGAADL